MRDVLLAGAGIELSFLDISNASGLQGEREFTMLLRTPYNLLVRNTIETLGSHFVRSGDVVVIMSVCVLAWARNVPIWRTWYSRHGNCFTCPRGVADAYATKLDGVAETSFFIVSICGQVCPAGAISQLTSDEKHLMKIGHAWFDRNTCLPHAKGDTA